MKKTLVLAALALASVAASAAGLSAQVKYDYDRAEDSAVSLSGHRVTTSVKYDFGSFIGAVDGGFVAGQAVVDNNRVNVNGFDVGYSNGVTLGALTLGGRIGFSQLNPGRIGNLTTHANLTSIAANVGYAVTPALTAVAGAEYIDARLKGVGDATATRYTAGVEYAVTKNVTVKGVYARTRLEGGDTNGLTTAVSYKF